MKLSKREKILLLVLVVFGTLALFTAYALLPAVSALTVEKQEVSALRSDVLSLQTEYEYYQDNLAELEAEKARSEELYGELYGEKTYDIGLQLSDMLARYNLTALELTIGDRTDSKLLDYQDEEGNQMYVGTGYAFCREVSLRFTGDRGPANAFMDALSEYDVRYVLHGMNTTVGAERTEYVVQLTLYEFDDTAANVNATVSEE